MDMDRRDLAVNLRVKLGKRTALSNTTLETIWFLFLNSQPYSEIIE